MLFLLIVTIGCAGYSTPVRAPSARYPGAAQAEDGAHGAKQGSSVRVNEGERLSTNVERISAKEAGALMLSLINRDRASQGLLPVVLDEGAPTVAALRHARDMAANAFLGHWGLDGSVPEQRHTEAGGVDMVLENALGLVDERKRALDPDALFERAQIVEAERMFFEEQPPNDGHRQNILKPWHTHVGIGFAMAKPGPNEIVFPCIVQEFSDHYGTHAPIPRKVSPGANVHIESTFDAGVSGGAVGLVKLPAVEKLTPQVANTRRSYPVPEPEETFWPKGFKTRIPVQLVGQTLRFDLPMKQEPGLYEISIWARLPGRKDYRIVSLRTITVE
jgi:uncharacterized protein YkwD